MMSTQIGPYQIQEELGRGGMGVVFKVLAPDGNLYALKLFTTRASSRDPRRLRRIQREVEALRCTNHPGLVRAIDAGVHGEAIYLVMEYVEGEPLAEAIRKRGAFPPREAAEICAGLARTLHYLHSKGLVHRDVKPANVIFDGEAIRLTDLGLVRFTDSQEGLTQEGAMVGTPGFCAPELLSVKHAQDVGPAVDVYGLGATLFALLAGEPPFQGDSAYEVAVRTAGEAPARPSGVLRAIKAKTPLQRSLDEVCLRCLAKDPAERYASALELAEELEFLALEASEAPASTGFGPAFGVGLLALGATLLLFYLALSPDPSESNLSAQGSPSHTQSSPVQSSPAQSSPAPKATPPFASFATPLAPSPDLAAKTSRGPRSPAPRREPSPRLRLEDGREVRRREDLDTLGFLTRAVWNARDTWSLLLLPDGALALKSRTANPLRYFHMSRPEPGPLRVSIRVRLLAGEKDASAGLIYGQPEERNYYLLNLRQDGRVRLLHRNPQGLQTRFSRRSRGSSLLMTFTEREGGGLGVSLDGKLLMTLGGAASPDALVGFHVSGKGRVVLSNFECDQPR